VNDDASDFADPRVLPPGQRRSEVLRPNHYGRVPTVKLSSWSLTIGGATLSGEPTVLKWPDIEAMEQIEVVADHHCASHVSTLDLCWRGVPASAILQLAPPADDAAYALVYAMYGYSSSIRVDDLGSPRAVFATAVDGQPLTPEHGWPLRLIIPHLYGFKGPKWVVSVEYHRELVRGFWEQRGYHAVGDVWREERYAHQE
jgi:DMSO/TMAO reductase YedYZ molybdopterin-dependent catalytic subunit